jgi:NAD(P)-dependent dehydrogenase (short-subunit alcohol dehydrogenase family)
MSMIDASKLLRPGLLEGVAVVLAGATNAGDASDSLGAGVASACTQLGARVGRCPLDADQSLDLEDDAVEQAVECLFADAGSIELLVVDGASMFPRADASDGHHDARHALRACLDGTWNVTRAVANRAFLPDRHGGRIVYLAPARDAGDHADAARAGLENLARTLSIEWARHGITTVAIASGGATSDEVAALTAYLASPAGAYFSGCLLDLRGVASQLDT